MDWGVLFGGICTLVGGFFGAWLLITSERKRLAEETKRRERVIVAGLWAELTDNRMIAEARVQATQLSNVPRSFVTVMWDAYKGEATFLGQEPYETVRDAYCTAHQANDIGEFAKAAPDLRMAKNFVDKQSRFIAERDLVEVVFKGAIDALSKYETEKLHVE